MPDTRHSNGNVPSMTNTMSSTSTFASSTRAAATVATAAIALPLKGNENVTDEAKIVDFLVQYGKIDEMTLNDTVIKMENVNIYTK